MVCVMCYVVRVCHYVTHLITSCAVVMKSANLNFLETPEPLQACNGTALPFIIRRDVKCIPWDVWRIRRKLKVCAND